jgi:hypothetical protein
MEVNMKRVFSSSLVYNVVSLSKKCVIFIESCLIYIFCDCVYCMLLTALLTELESQ